MKYLKTKVNSGLLPLLWRGLGGGRIPLLEGVAEGRGRTKTVRANNYSPQQVRAYNYTPQQTNNVRANNYSPQQNN
jgi:hypothetical protein